MAPNPPPLLTSASSAGERQHHANGRGAVVIPAREKVPPGTPRREKSHGRESSAMQDPGLKDYVRGDTPPDTEDEGGRYFQDFLGGEYAADG